MFTFKDNKIVPDANVLSLPWFKVIWEKDKTKEKEQALLDLTYIFHVVDHRSPYYQYAEEQRRESIVRDIMGGKYKESKEIITAIDKYKEFTKTLSSDLLDSVKSMIYKLKNYYNDISFDVDGDVEIEMKKADSIVKSASNLGKVLESLATLDEKVKKERTSHDDRVMGGFKLGLFSE